MSRTYKDQKKNKNKHRWQKEPGLRTRYYEIKTNGYEDNFDYQICPDCRGICEYERGYTTCGECHWGEFVNENENQLNDELEFSRAS